MNRWVIIIRGVGRVFGLSGVQRSKVHQIHIAGFANQLNDFKINAPDAPVRREQLLAFRTACRKEIAEERLAI